MDSGKIKRILSAVLKLAVSAGAIYYIFSKIDTSEILDLFQRSSALEIVIAFALLVLSQLISADRLRILLNSSDIHPERVWNYKLYFVGMAYNLFLPGGIGGDAYKVVVYSRNFNVKKRVLALWMIIDRMSGMEAILAWLSVCIMFLELPVPLSSLYWLFIPLSLIVVVFLVRKFIPSLLRNLGRVLVLALMVQSIQVACVYFLAKGIGFEAEFAQVTVIFLLSTLATTIPVFMGGIGAREAVFGLLAIDWGLSESAAVAVGLAFSAITIISSVPGLYFDWTLKKNRLDSEQAEVATSE